MAALEDLIKLKRHSHIHDIVVLDAEMHVATGFLHRTRLNWGRCFDKLIGGGIRCVSIRHDKIHMEDFPFNRKTMMRYDEVLEGHDQSPSYRHGDREH